MAPAVLDEEAALFRGQHGFVAYALPSLSTPRRVHQYIDRDVVALSD
jgi:hypothetical protein